MERKEVGTDPVQEWGSPGSDTGLEESTWQLGLGGGGDVAYPERPGEDDCTYYLRTGFCGYGPRCRFNHPPDRSSVMGVMRAAGGGFPERTGQPVCQYYMRTGMCKFGSSCKYDHPRQGSGSATPVSISMLGYPLRPGEKECSYYIKTGHCKFGMTCKFHHPQPAGIQVQAPTGGPLPLPTLVPPSAIYPTMQSPQALSSQQYGVMAGNWPVARPALVPRSYVQGPYSPMLLPQGMVPLPGWNSYQAHVSQVGSPSTSSAVGVYGITQLSASAPAYTGAYLPEPSTGGPSNSSPKEHKFPERPGQAECQYYMKTGDCKFGSSCRYHHPPEWIPPKLSFTLSPLGFPLRPGAPLCAPYPDISVAPYPVGSSLGTLAPSSSSSDLRRSNKDTLYTRMPSSVSTPSGSVGSILSKSGTASHPSAQQSGQASLSSTTSSSESKGSDVHTSS